MYPLFFTHFTFPPAGIKKSLNLILPSTFRLPPTAIGMVLTTDIDQLRSVIFKLRSPFIVIRACLDVLLRKHFEPCADGPHRSVMRIVIFSSRKLSRSWYLAGKDNPMPTNAFLAAPIPGRQQMKQHNTSYLSKFDLSLDTWTLIFRSLNLNSNMPLILDFAPRLGIFLLHLSSLFSYVLFWLFSFLSLSLRFTVHHRPQALGLHAGRSQICGGRRCEILFRKDS